MTQWCSECKMECEPKTIDVGIGPYEFWGEKGVDKQLVEVSACCETEMLDTDPWCSECQGEPVEDWGMCSKCLEREQQKAA